MNAEFAPTLRPRAPRTNDEHRVFGPALASLLACLLATACQPLEQPEIGVDGSVTSGSGGQSGLDAAAGSRNDRATGGNGSSPGTGGNASNATGGSNVTKTGGTGGPSSASGGSSPGTGGATRPDTGGSGTGGTSASGGKTGTGGSSSGTGGSASGTGGAMTCSGQTHMCLGSCVSNAAPSSCGTSCDPCQAPAGGTATCDGTKCDFNCSGMKKCGAKCVPNDGCCSDSDCPAQNGMARQCDTASNTCKVSGCAPSYKPCGTSCIATSACCSANDCTGVCQTCSGPGGSCVAVKNADDGDSCAGTCDGSGACKSKRGQTCNTVSGGCIGGTTCASDGYCCNTACTGSCQACDIPGMQGTCTPVASGAPHGNRQACTSDGSNCGGRCSGKSDGTCDYPTGNCGDGPTCMTMTSFVPQRTCSAGRCQSQSAMTCADSFACVGKACKQSCAGDSDCAPGHVCANDHTCIVMSTTETIYFDTALSGNIDSNGVVIAQLLKAGDASDNSYTCAFASFKLSLIPKGATVRSATLTISQINVVGDPYAGLKRLKAQRISYPTLDKKNAFNPAASAETDMSSTAAITTKSLNVTSWVADDVSKGASNTQFRFCFEEDTDGDGVQDFVQLASATGKPQLVVTYNP